MLQEFAVSTLGWQSGWISTPLEEVQDQFSDWELDKQDETLLDRAAGVDDYILDLEIEDCIALMHMNQEDA